MGRYFTIGFFVFFAVMLIVLSIPSFIDWNKYKGTIESALSDASGYQVSVEGPVSFAVLPQPALTLSGVSATSGDGTPFLTLDNLAGRIALAPLLTGKVRVTTLKISGAHLRTDAQDLSVRATDEIASHETGRPRGFEGFVVGLVQDVRVDSLVIDNFKVGSGDAEAIPALVIDDGSVSFLSLNGPFSTESTVVINGKRFRLTGELGQIRPDQSSAFSVQGFSGDGTEISVKGSARSLKDAPTFQGTLELAGKGFAPLFDILQVFGGGARGKDEPVPISLDAPLSLTGDLLVSPDKVSASSLAMQLGDSRAVVALDLDHGERLTGTMTLRATKLDGDKLLEGLKVEPPKGGESALQVDVDVRSEGVVYHGKVLSNLALLGRLDEGGFGIGSLDMTAPGSTKVSVKNGNLNKGVWGGDLKVISQNAREFAGWLGADVSSVPSGKLGLGQVTGKLRLEDGGVRLNEMVLDVDGDHYTGSFAKGTGARGSYVISLEGARLDLSDYRGQNDLESLANLADDYDAQMDLKFASFTGAGLDDVALDVELKARGGGVTLDRLSVVSTAGETFSASGALDILKKNSLKGQLDWRLSNWQSCRIFEILKLQDQISCAAEDKAALAGHLSLNQGIGATSAKGVLGSDKVDVRASGVQVLWRDETGEISLKGSGTHKGYAATFDGAIRGVGADPLFIFNGSLQAADGAAALADLGYKMPGVTGAFKADGAFEWGDGSFKAENVKASIGSVTASGTLALADAGDTRKVDSKVVLNNFDLGSLAANGLIIEDKSGGWSTTSLEPLLAEDLRGTVDVTLKNARVDGLSIPTAAIKGVISEKSSEWALYQGELWGGAWTGKAILSRKGSGFVVEARGAGEGLDYAEVTNYLTGREAIEGRGSLRFVLSGNGKSAKALAQSLTGSIDVESREGRMMGFDLTGYALDLGQASGALGVRIASDENLTHGASNYHDISGRFDVTNGSAQTSQWQGKSDVGNLYFGLDADFAQQQMGGQVEFSFEGAENLPTFAYVLHGWGSDLSGDWDTEAMQQIFEALLQAERQAAEEAAAQNAPPANDNPAPSGREVESGDLAPIQ